MTRISATLSGIDLTAQNNLLRATASFQLSATRLATARRINRGSDDPAGLIAVETLRSELVAFEQANRNADRAASIVRVADSGLSQVSGILNRISKNVLAAASGTLSGAELEATQLEINAGLEAINRIGRTTSFGGRNLLDSSAGYQVSTVDPSQIQDIQVFSANNTPQTLDIEVLQAASSAQVVLTDADATLDTDISLVVQGDQGSEVLEFTAGTSLDTVAEAVNSTTISTGVTASVSGTELTFSSEAVGSDAQVSVEAVAGSVDLSASTATGTDVVVQVNGTTLTGDGNSVAVRTNTIEADIVFAEGFTGTISTVNISGEGLRFLLSPNPGQVTSIGLPNISAAALGGVAGRLSDLASGGSASVASGRLDVAQSIINGARQQVLSAQARAGAFVGTTIQSAQSLFDSAEVALTGAISRILDTDFAAETSRLVRASILTDAAIASVRITSDRVRAPGRLLALLSGGPI